MIKGISNNTKLSFTNDIADKTDNKLTEWLNKSGLGGLIGKDGKVSDDLNALTKVNPVDDVFSDYHILTVSENNQTSRLSIM